MFKRCAFWDGVGSRGSIFYEDGGCPSTASRPAVDGRVVAGPVAHPSKSKGGLIVYIKVEGGIEPTHLKKEKTIFQWLFLVPLKGGIGKKIIPQLAGKMPLIYHLYIAFWWVI